MEIKRLIWVQFQREGIHRYPAAGTEEALADVSFLQYPHRHMFHFKVNIEVVCNDRDIEFIQFKRWLEGLYSGTLQLNDKSCEQIAEDLLYMVTQRYPGRDVTCSVSEDNENGAFLIHTAPRNKEST